MIKYDSRFENPVVQYFQIPKESEQNLAVHFHRNSALRTQSVFSPSQNGHESQTGGEADKK